MKMRSGRRSEAETSRALKCEVSSNLHVPWKTRLTIMASLVLSPDDIAKLDDLVEEEPGVEAEDEDEDVE